MTKKHIDELEHISSTDFRDNFAESIEKAIRQPLIITRRMRPIAVVMYYEDYEILKELDNK